MSQDGGFRGNLSIKANADTTTKNSRDMKAQRNGKNDKTL